MANRLRSLVAAARSRRDPAFTTAFATALVFAVLAGPGCDRADEAAASVEAATHYEQPSEAGHFVVRVEPRSGKAPLRSLHEWTVLVTDPEGVVVRPTRLNLAAGMQQHGHGMETRPRVVESLPDGRHVIAGMKFNMAGEWQLRVDVADGATSDVANFDVQIEP